MVPGAFQIIFDHEQTRVQKHPVFATIKGLLWNGGVFDDAWIDLITNTLMIRPMCKYTGWQATNTGIFAKPAISAYEFQTSGNWAAFEKYVGGGQTFMQGSADNANPGWIRTATAPGKNRGVNLALFGYGAGDFTEIAQFGWDDSDVTYDGSAIGFRLYSDGSVYVYKAGESVGDGKINLSTGSPNLPLEIMLLPMRKRELLVVGQGDDGFRVVFPDIDETDTNPTITPAEKFWFKMIGSDATRDQVQITPLAFEESAYANSVLINFQRPPATGASLQSWTNPVFTGITTANLYGDKAYAGSTDVISVTLVETDGSTPFVADGTLNTARMKCVMEGDGSYTPFIYGAVMEYEGETDVTDDSEEVDVTPFCSELSISVGDDPWGVKASITLRLEAGGNSLESVVAKLKVLGDRPCKILCDTLVLIDGRCGEPQWNDSLSDETQTVRFDVYDLSAQLEAFVFRDDFPLDGFRLSNGTSNSAVRQIAYLAGLSDSQMDLSADSYLIPEIPGQKSEEFSYAVPIGDDAKQAIEDLFRNFAASWFLGVRPTGSGPELWFKSPADLGTTPKMTVYRTAAAAISASKPGTQVYQNHRSETEEVGANELWVTGQDQRTGEIIQAYLIDAAAQDCTLAPSMRSDNWAGEPDIYGVQDSRFRTQADLERAIDLLAPAVMVKRTLGEFEAAEMLWYTDGDTLPIWRGDFITLEDEGNVQISSCQFTVVLNDDATGIVTNAKYTYGGLTNAGGTSLSEIQASNRARYEKAKANQAFNFTRNSIAYRVVRTEVP